MFDKNPTPFLIKTFSKLGIQLPKPDKSTSRKNPQLTSHLMIKQ